MQNILLFIFLLAITGCAGTGDEAETSQADKAATVASPAAPTDVQEDSLLVNDENAIFYISFVDTGKDYYALNKQMYELSSALKLEIDTMNRYYSKGKNEIVVPEDDEDEMYRGEYYPRRYSGDFLSLEQLYAFSNDRKTESFALIAGIYDNQASADSMLRIIKAKAPKAYVSKTSLYIGCMH